MTNSLNIQTVARAGLASLFILAGLNKVLNPAATIATITEAGIPLAQLFYFSVIGIEWGGALLVIRGVRVAVPSALVLAAFTLATNLFFHRFWEMQPPIRPLQLSLFFKNVAIAFALVYVAIVEHRTGRHSA
jgi:putative oxidoreductase